MRAHRPIRFALLCAAALLAPLGAVAQAPAPLREDWRKLVDGTLTNGEEDDDDLDAAFSVALDAAGNAVVAGILVNAATREDFAVLKLAASDGHELWRFELDGTETDFDFDFDVARDVAVDASGDVFVVGILADDENTLDDIVVVRLDGETGDELWTTVIDGEDHAVDEAGALALTPSGDVLISGVIDNGDGGDFYVARLSAANGSVTWEKAFDGSEDVDEDVSFDVASDAAGNAVAAGRLTSETTGDDFVVMKLAAADGATLWSRSIDGTTPLADFDRADAVVVDSAGNVFAGGSLENVGDLDDVYVVKLDGSNNGVTLWDEVIAGSSNGFDAVRALALVGDDVVAGGYLDQDATDRDLLVVRFAGSDGDELWRRTIDGSFVGLDADAAFGVVAAGPNVYAAGVISNAGTGEDLAIVALDATSGADRGQRAVDGGGAGFDAAQGLAASGNGAVVAGFLGRAGDPADDFVALKVPEPTSAAACAAALGTLTTLARRRTASKRAGGGGQGSATT